MRGRVCRALSDPRPWVAIASGRGVSGESVVSGSGYGSREDLQRSADAGFDAHFVKPMEIAELQAFMASRQGA